MPKLLPIFVGLVLAASLSLTSAAPESRTEAYIVVLEDDVSAGATTLEIEREHGITSEHIYSKTVKGFSASMPQTKADRIKTDPRVKAVVADRPVQALAQTLPTGINRIDADLNANEGGGVGVAVIDTGIDLSHPDLAANIVAGTNCIRPRRSANDDNGHGTHVAGTIAAQNNSRGVVGAAFEAKLIAVKVLNSSGAGTWSSVICGIDWVTANAARYNIKVANMSLGGSGSSDNQCGTTDDDVLHQAICRSRDAGVTYVVAAGNSGADASNSVPAAYDDAVITVSALADSDGQSGGTGTATSYGPDDTFASFSNWGSVVDLGAPGVSIYSTYRSGKYRTFSGTSMAAPHVAGAAVLYIKSNPSATWSEVRDALIAAAEALGAGHTDPSGKHPEPVVKANSL